MCIFVVDHTDIQRIDSECTINIYFNTFVMSYIDVEHSVCPVAIRSHSNYDPTNLIRVFCFESLYLANCADTKKTNERSAQRFFLILPFFFLSSNYLVQAAQKKRIAKSYFENLAWLFYFHCTINNSIISYAEAYIIARHKTLHSAQRRSCDEGNTMKWGRSGNYEEREKPKSNNQEII